MRADKLRVLTDKIALCAKVFNKLHLMFLSAMIFKFKDKIVVKYLKKTYSNFINNYTPKYIPPKKHFDKSPVFVCWLQGEENAPVIVEKCINSIRRHVKNHPIVLISEKNLGEYIDIPTYIMDEVNSGRLTRTSYSDIIRSSLLASYGGMWIDATFFISKDLPSIYFDYPLFSAAKQPEPANRRNVCISRYRWTGSFIGSSKNNHLLFCFLRDFFYEYEKNEVVFIDYLLVDYIIFLAYLNFESVKKDIDFIPNNNINFGWLFHVMNKVFDPEECKKALGGETFTYKLSWKMKWKRNFKNKKTFYGAFLDGELDDKCYTT